MKGSKVWVLEVEAVLLQCWLCLVLGDRLLIFIGTPATDCVQLHVLGSSSAVHAVGMIIFNKSM